jgi:hypothetical protein
MPILKDQGRQWVLSAEIPFSFDDDFGEDTAADTAVVQSVVRMPTNARVVGGEIVVETVWNNGTTATVDIGDVTDPDRYTASPVDLTAAGRTALTLDGFKTTETERDIDFTPVFAGSNASQGQGYLRVQYVIEDRENEVQPLDVADFGSARAPETG